MKKSTVAIGIIAILGIGYVGTSWYTGNVIESNIDKKLEQITNEFNRYQQKSNLAIDYSDYQKNLFSTKLHLTITVSPKEGTDSSFGTETIFDDDITIHHGPFPIAALSKGNFAPQMAWVEYEMTEQASPELWMLAGNKPFITGHIGMSYQEYLTIKLANRAITTTAEDLLSLDGKLDISAGEVSFESNKDFSNLLINAHLDKLDYADDDTNAVTLNKFNLSAHPNAEKTGINYQLGINNVSFTIQEYYSTPSMTFDNIKSQGSIVYTNENVDAQTTIDKITFVPDIERDVKDKVIVMNHLSINQKSQRNDTKQNVFDGALTSSIASLFFGQQNMGNGSFDFAYQGVDEEFALRKVMASNRSYDNDESDNKKPINMTLSLNKFNWHNEAGDVQTSANVVLSSDDMNDLDIENIDALNIKIDIPFTVLAQFAAQAESPQTTTVTQGQLNKANQSMQMMAGMFLRSSPLVTFNKGETKGIYSDVELTKDRDEVKVNGKTLSKEEFFDSFN